MDLPPRPPHPATSETVVYDGLAFRQRTSLHLWGVLTGIGGALAVLYYLFKQMSLLWFDGPTPAEHTALGIYFLTWGLLLAAGCVAFLYRATEHPMRPVTAWAATGVAAAFSLLFATTSLWGAAFGDHTGVGEGASTVLTMLLVNPFTYIAGTPAVLTIITTGHLRHPMVRIVAALAAAGVLIPFVASAVL